MFRQNRLSKPATKKIPLAGSLDEKSIEYEADNLKLVTWKKGIGITIELWSYTYTLSLGIMFHKNASNELIQRYYICENVRGIIFPRNSNECYQLFNMPLNYCIYSIIMTFQAWDWSIMYTIHVIGVISLCSLHTRGKNDSFMPL